MSVNVERFAPQRGLLEARQCEPELMDQEALPVAEHRAALRGLRRLNAVSNSVRHLWNVLAEFARTSERPLRVLDLACGGGDIAVRLSRLAQRHGLRMSIHACDISPTALSVAREVAVKAGVHDLETFRLDVLQDELPRDYDVIFCSLFLHHLSHQDAPRVLRAMAQAARSGIVVDDLLRSPLGYALCAIAPRLMSRSKIVHIDGMRSIRAAYSKAELEGLLAAAGLSSATVEYHWPERFLLSWGRR